MFKKIYKKIEEFDTIVIARHIGVDPDALCSQLALRDSIRLTYPNKKVSAIGTGSAKFAHIGKLDKLERFTNALLIVCDTPDRKRIDSVDFSQYGCVIKIDHHPFVEKIGDIELIDDTKTSASEIIMELILNTELLCNKEIAELLYMGLVSDSNRFLFNNCSSSTFKNVSEILKDFYDALEDKDHLEMAACISAIKEIDPVYISLMFNAMADDDEEE
jgi:phosphoesterase RecJ-like protein